MADEESADEERSWYDTYGTPSECSTTAQNVFPISFFLPPLPPMRSLSHPKRFELVPNNAETRARTNQDDGGGTAASASAAEGSVEFEPLVTGQSKQIWSLVVGILGVGAITTLFNAIGKRSNYQSQSDMHRSAVKALEKICLSIDFERERFNRNVRDLEHSDSEFDGGKDLNTALGADLKTHQASFQAMLDACCDSPAPTEVVQAFNELDSIFAKQVYNRDCELGKVSDVEHDLMYFYHQLWKKFSKYLLWPLKAPLWLDVGKSYNEWKKGFRHIEGYAVKLDRERMMSRGWHGAISSD